MIFGSLILLSANSWRYLLILGILVGSRVMKELLWPEGVLQTPSGGPGPALLLATRAPSWVESQMECQELYFLSWGLHSITRKWYQLAGNNIRHHPSHWGNHGKIIGKHWENHRKTYWNISKIFWTIFMVNLWSNKLKSSGGLFCSILV